MTLEALELHSVKWLFKVESKNETVRIKEKSGSAPNFRVLTTTSRAERCCGNFH